MPLNTTRSKPQNRAGIWLSLLLGWLLMGQPTMAANLVPDASFEGRLPAWLPEDQASYYLAKVASPTAADGSTVLLIQAWHGGAARILSPTLPAPARTVSMTCQIRHRGPVGEVTVELVLYHAETNRVLGSGGRWSADGSGEWRIMGRDGIQVGDSLSGLLDDLNDGKAVAPGMARDLPGLPGKAAPAVNRHTGTIPVRLGLLVRGPQRGHELEIDQLGLFPDDVAAPVSDNAVEILLTAGDFASPGAWQVKEIEALYDGGPAGTELVSTAQDGAATATIEVPMAGYYRLWSRFRSSSQQQMEKGFTLGVRQGERQHHASPGQADYGKRGDPGWYWGGIEVELKAGPVTIVVTPVKGKSGIRVSDLLLTSNPDYVPQDNDLFTTPAYMRFVNESATQEPYLLWVYIRTHDIKSPHQHMGMYGMSGVNGYFPPKDTEMFIQSGETTPWLRLSDVLFADRWTHRNSLSVTATRQTRLGGHLTGEFKGELQFAVGPERRIIKRVPIEQHSPTIQMTLPYDFGRHPEEVMAPMDYVRQKQEVVAALPARQGANARHLEIIIHNPPYDSSARDVVEGELAIVKRLGANTIRRVPSSQAALDFYAREGMGNRFTLQIHTVWGMLLENSMYHPDLAQIESTFAKAAEELAETKGQIARVILADEPGGLSHEVMRNSPRIQKAFEAYLASVGLRDQLDEHFDDLLGDRASYEPFDPTEDRDRKLAQPKFFYHMELFRLQGMGHLVRELTRLKNLHFPATARSLVNHVPYHSAYGSWVSRGVDPYFCFGEGGLELPWTEDWMAYGAGTQEMSPLYALLRSAGRANGSPLGGYVVVKDGSAQLVRKKLYTALAGGMREIDLYNYDPPYSGWLNSWSEQFEKYPVIQQTLEEFGAIDAAFHETTRRPTDIAILYNRTQAIWANPGYTAYYDIDLVHWALAHAGYDADYISEEEIDAGLLDQYKVLYVGGEHLKQSCAERIAEWVRNGGTLCGQTGAGMRDEYHEPRPAWDTLFGATAEQPRDTRLSLPRQRMKLMEPVDHVTTVAESGPPTVSYANYSYTELLQPTTATVFMTRADGTAAGTIHRYGEGHAIRFAGAPGIAYLCGAVKDEAYDVRSFLPTAFDPALRDLIAWPARLAGARRVAETAEPIMEIVRYDKPGTAVLILIDHDATPKDNVVLRVPEAGHFRRAWTATGQPVALESDGNVAQLSLPLNMCEAIVLEE